MGNDVSKFYDSAIDPLDNCTHPPKEGETTISDCPFDCIGIIIGFMGNTRDILSFRNSCKMMYNFFSDRNIMRRVEFNYNKNFDIRKKVPFIFKINIDALWVDRLRNKTFKLLPNLTHLKIQRTLVDHSISSVIFSYYPNLEEFQLSHGKFIIDETFNKLSQKIRVFSLTSLPDCGNIKSFRKDKVENSFTKVLLNRPSLTVIKLWNFKFDLRDVEFITKLHEKMVNLKILSLRYSSFDKVKSSILTLPLHLEELDLNDTAHAKEIVFPEIKSVLKRLHIANGYTFKYLEEQMKDKSNSVFQSVVYLDISRSRPFSVGGSSIKKPDNFFTEILPTLFPNLVHLRIINSDCPLNDSIVEALMNNMKKLRKVRIALNQIRKLTYHGTTTMRITDGISKYIEGKRGVQEVGNISFVAY